MEEVTQGGPFKEAWYHDFAPPIHSLDRHGDFAPPLLALALNAGFFGLATDVDGLGNGLQYHLAQVYGPHNIGDWLDVKATNVFDPDMGDARVQGNNRAMLFHATPVPELGGETGDITFWIHGDTPPRDVVTQITGAGLYYFLDGQTDLGYTEGGNLVRYSGGGGILFYTTDGTLPNAGDFQVITNQTVDDSTYKAGAAIFDMSNGSGADAGDLQVLTYASGGGNPGGVAFGMGSYLSPSSGDFKIKLPDGGTHVVLDHLGSPLVTYTG